MKKLLGRVRIKWAVYILELIIIYILQNTPNLIPSFLGVSPVLLIIFAISITMFEGESRGMWIGLFAGILLDLGGSMVFGFYSMLMTVVCFFCGILVVYLMRNNIITAMVLAAASVFVVGMFQWFFKFALWGDTGTWYFLYGVLLPRVVYTTLLMPIAFYFNRAIATHLEDDE